MGSRFERLPFAKKGSRPAPPPPPPKHLRRACGCPNGQRRLERGWKILSLRFPQYLAAPLLGKRKKKRTRWLISFITSAHGSLNEVPSLSERLMLPTPEVTSEANQ